MASKNTRFDHNRLEPDSVDDTALPEIYTPTEAAEKLAVKESWLRRKAGARAIPCTLLGKHLRFSEKDLRDIVQLARISFPSRQRR
ncbi:helix-turn-helix domain-containing protein [Allosaccharopolyspora coralli]|uniref:Helix-turn-helix domain-containing protein n=1 Tax=Allosaccharopolyspora coralli TaxID=2665642 RepID=A0A5Q3Q4N7_9PSEU|nr:helix-turn-helix domain-containing protein [Allosaccharopolyspora coralli]QGK69578.1 helix-turn-helix domain-containing protein [Allosaccharopolyspora coralli]